jgi:hypothetical protein
VKELIEYAFDQFDYEEPFGMEIVTIFQSHHPDSLTGWITTDTTKSCAEEIKTHDFLCFAYYMPDIFYFAEGGWGHHMDSLGNRPHIPNEVALKLCFGDFRNTVIINGNYTLMDIIQKLKQTGYIESVLKNVKVSPSGAGSQILHFSLSDPVMNISLTDFLGKLEQICGDAIGPIILNLD